MYKQASKILSIQGIRAFAFLLIFISHCDYLIVSELGKNPLGYLGGWGVSIFLILSGYLSARNLFFDNKLSITELLKISYLKLQIRFIKIFPLHLFTLLISFPFSYKALFFEFSLSKWLSLLVNIFLLQAWLPIKGDFNFVSWYLSVFLFISFIGVFLCYFFQNNQKIRNKSFLIGMFLVILQLIICIIFKNHSLSHKIIYFFPLTRIVDFIIGICLYYVSIEIKNVNKSNCCFIFGMVLGILISYFSYGAESEFFSVVLWSIPSFLIIIGTVSNTIPASSFLENKTIVWLGNISFELFLIHQLAIRYSYIVLRKIGYSPNVITYFMVFVLSVLFAVIWKNISNKVIIKLPAAISTTISTKPNRIF